MNVIVPQSRSKLNFQKLFFLRTNLIFPRCWDIRKHYYQKVPISSYLSWKVDRNSPKLIEHMAKKDKVIRVHSQLPGSWSAKSHVPPMLLIKGHRLLLNTCNNSDLLAIEIDRLQDRFYLWKTTVELISFTCEWPNLQLDPPMVARVFRLVVIHWWPRMSIGTIVNRPQVTHQIFVHLGGTTMRVRILAIAN